MAPTEKILFKFSTIRNAKRSKKHFKLADSQDDIEILKSISQGESDKVIKDKISRTLESISGYTSTGVFKMLLNLHDSLEKKVENNTINQDVLQELSKMHLSSFEIGPKELVDLKNLYNNLLASIQLGSNHTKEEFKEDFIALLKVRSVIDLIESPQESSAIRWIDVYSATFVLPGNRQAKKQESPGSANSEYEKNKKELIDKYNGTIGQYKDTIAKINQIESAIQDIKEIETYHQVDVKDFDNQRFLSDLNNSRLFKSIFSDSIFQRTSKGSSTLDETINRNIASQVSSVLNAKNNTVVKQLKEIMPKYSFSETDIKTGAALQNILSEKVYLESTAETIQRTFKRDFDIYLDPKYIPDIIDYDFTPLPFPVPLPPVPEKEKEEEALFELLISDLILVEEKDVGYKASAIAHIETAMEGELRSKTHRTLDRNESKIFTSESVSIQQHLNLATNSQSDFNSEVENSLSRKFGGEVSAGYNNKVSYVDVKAYYDDESDKLEQTIKEAAEEVTEEARTEITRKVLKERTEISISEVEIINEHKIENNFGKGHLNGIYQWVDQVKELRTLNYGRHLMAKFILLNPAKRLFEETIKDKTLENLKEFPISGPEVIRNMDLALKYGKEYGISDFEIPPNPVKQITHVIEYSKNTTEEQKSGYLLHHENIQVPGDGYLVTKITVQYRCPWINPTQDGERKQLTITALGCTFEVSSVLNKNQYTLKNQYGALGKSISYFHSDEGNSSFRYTAGDVRFEYFINDDMLGLKDVPIAIMTRNNNYFQATVTIHLESSSTSTTGITAFQKWQIRTYDKLYQAYINKKEELERQARNDKEDKVLHAITGQNPQKNKQTIEDEIKHLVIAALSKDFIHPSDEYTDVIGSELPANNPSKIMEYTRIIDFFEHAIDWKKIAYSLYSYHWLNYQEWNPRQQYEDTDPHFEAFMKAGAAETIIPIKRGFERKFIHYLNNKQLWNHNEPLSLTSQNYADILVEINEFETEEVESKPVGSPWRLQIPTNLIILSEKNTLDEVPPLQSDTNDPETEEDNG